VVVHKSKYRLPLEGSGYLPDPTEPVDRWVQAANASNVRTTMAVVRELLPTPAEVLIDPLAGGGSSAAAARAMGLPFFGIELDPVLACITLAKTVCTPRHARLLGELPPPDAVELPVRPADAMPGDPLAVSCLALISALRTEAGRPLAPGELSADLAAARAAHPASRVVHGDATGEQAWAALRLPQAPAVVYTSPPFGASSPRPPVSPAVRSAAQRILATAGLSQAACEPAEFDSYLQATLSVVRRLAAHTPRATLIIEPSTGLAASMIPATRPAQTCSP
jgi:hypothetical protein